MFAEWLTEPSIPREAVRVSAVFPPQHFLS